MKQLHDALTWNLLFPIPYEPMFFRVKKIDARKLNAEIVNAAAAKYVAVLEDALASFNSIYSNRLKYPFASR